MSNIVSTRLWKQKVKVCYSVLASICIIYRTCLVSVFVYIIVFVINFSESRRAEGIVRYVAHVCYNSATAICTGSHLDRCNVCRLRQRIGQVAEGSLAEAIGSGADRDINISHYTRCFLTHLVSNKSYHHRWWYSLTL